MLLDVSRSEAEAILGAMLAIAYEHGSGEITEVDRATIDGAATIVLGIEGLELAELERIGPEALTAAIGSAEEAKQAVRMLAVMSVVDGVADPEKTALVRGYATALDVHEGYLEILTEVATDEIAQATACIMRKNVKSFPRLDPDRLAESAVAPFLPYADAPDPELEATYEALGAREEGSFGRAFYDHFKSNSFAFPGARDGLAEGFTTPHDSAHVLAGYSTAQPGEICVSTFIGAMHPDHPMAAEVLPVLYSWHLGIKLNDAAGSYKGAYEPWISLQRTGTSGARPSRSSRVCAATTASPPPRPSCDRRDRRLSESPAELARSMMRSVPFFLVDVFSRSPLSGNPLAVVPEADDLEPELPAAIAREFNQSETTFLLAPSLPGADHRLRSLTPAGVVVGGAGHNALGAWWWLASAGRLELADGVNRFRQEIEGRVLDLEVLAEGGAPQGILMAQEPPVSGAVAKDLTELAASLGLRSADLGERLPIGVVSTGAPHLLVLAQDRRAVDRAVPDPQRLARVLRSLDGEGCYLYSLDPVGSDASAYARFFNPTVGIAEDPATGTAAGPLACHLAEHGLVEDDARVVIEQGHAIDRASRIEVRLRSAGPAIVGACCIAAEGTLRL